jgi:nucleoside phosphorylase
MPLELSPLVAAADLNGSVVQINGRRYYEGTLAGSDVVLAMTGVGMVNAEETATLAFEHSRCSFRATLFSGVAGSRRNIADVAVPAQWTSDHGATFTNVNAAMLAVAGTLDASSVGMSRDVPVGDAACLCPGVDGATPVRMPQDPALYVGGKGTTADPYGGHAVPCLPGGGDVAGCEPCFGPGTLLDNAARFATDAPPVLGDPGFWLALFSMETETTGDYDAQDQETAAVAETAARYDVPFLGVRAASDGNSDPLGLPGFPAQFFAYRQLAANNAAAVTIAFLDAWTAQGQPVL